MKTILTILVSLCLVMRLAAHLEELSINLPAAQRIIEVLKSPCPTCYPRDAKLRLTGAFVKHGVFLAGTNFVGDAELYLLRCNRGHKFRLWEDPTKAMGRQVTAPMPKLR